MMILLNLGMSNISLFAALCDDIRLISRNAPTKSVGCLNFMNKIVFFLIFICTFMFIEKRCYIWWSAYLMSAVIY